MNLETELTRYRYEAIAASLADQIGRGVFRAGESLPSIRALSRKERCSVGVITQAMAVLEAKGYVEARPRSGYYVRTRAELIHPASPLDLEPLEPTRVGVSDLAAQVFHAASNRQLVPLGTAVVAPELLPNEKISRHLAAASREYVSSLGHYEHSDGSKRLRHVLSQRCSIVYFDVSEEEITVTVGAMEALNLAIRAVAKPGEIVAVESPCYFGNLDILESLGMKAIGIPCSAKTGIHLDVLKTALERFDIKALVINTNFSNPSGHCMSETHRRALISLLDDYGVPCIEDDVYGDLSFNGVRPLPLKAYDTKGMVIYCTSFSKCLSPGLRIGWVAGGRFTERVRRLKYITTFTGPLVAQLGLARYLETEAYDRHLRRLQGALETQMLQMIDLVHQAFPEGTAISQPQGGCCLWVELPHGVSGMRLYELALKEGISLAPGELFSAQGKFTNYIRLSTGQPINHQIHEAITILGRFSRDLMLDSISI
ncbi:MAG: PLP-dependent aminotransferase family protein [Opitutales bacterium]|nr:PLP-dependent aminotransferase family protein [Opitutales bacterium]